MIRIVGDAAVSSSIAPDPQGIDFIGDGAGRTVTGTDADSVFALGSESSISDLRVITSNGGDNVAKPNGDATLKVERSALRAHDTGIFDNGGLVTASSVLITVSGESSGNRAIFSANSNASVDARHVTALTLGTSGTGVDASDSSRVTVRHSIVRGFATDLLAHKGATLGASTSDFATITGAEDLGGNLNQDPRFLDPAAGNYRLTPQSPLVDAGGTEPFAAGESVTDLRGAARMLDGNDDGIIGRDMGAYEYRPPVAALTVSNPSPVQGESVTFDPSGSAVGDSPISTFQFDLDADGVFESATAGPPLAHAYANAGRVTVRLQPSRGLQRPPGPAQAGSGALPRPAAGHRPCGQPLAHPHAVLPRPERLTRLR